MYYAVIAESLEELRSSKYNDMINTTIDRNLRVEILDRALELIKLELDYLANEWDGCSHE